MLSCPAPERISRLASRLQNLAISNPSRAVANADSHEYFAETRPEAHPARGAARRAPCLPHLGYTPGMNRLLALALLAVLSIHCTKAAVPDTPAQPLECRIEPVSPLLAGGPVALRFSLVNRTAEPLWVLRWNTPLEGWRGTLFTVTANGTEIPYQGPMLKRGDPRPADYVEIPAGESASATVDLSEVYEIGQPGRYEVKVTANLHDVAKDGASVPRPRDRHEAMELGCEGVALEVKAQ